ncbi:MAG: hypothetical protein NTW76_06055 [Corynebacteriales bacterium]|nr:hypothetical protein [Mycobacteriales bacterium]
MTTPPPYQPPGDQKPAYANASTPKRSKKPWIFGGIGAVVVILVVAGIAGGGGDDSPNSAAASSTAPVSTVTVSAEATTTTEPTQAAPVAPPETATSTPTPQAQVPQAEGGVMPAVVCLDLQAAQDLIQENGVFFSRSEDATGQGRLQVIDRNWIVVAQDPAPGSPVSEAQAVLSVVKDSEPNNC